MYKENNDEISKNDYASKLREHDKKFKTYKILCRIAFIVALIYAISVPIISYLTCDGQILTSYLLSGIQPSLIVLIVHTRIIQKDEQLKDEIIHDMINSRNTENQYYT